MAFVERLVGPDYSVRWQVNDVKLKVEEATKAGLAKVAFAIEGQAKTNIVANDQVDTGFMLNTVYHVADAGDRKVSTYSQTAQDGAHATKGGRAAERTKANEEALPGAPVVALVAVGADYAIYQEMMIPFLFPAAEKVAGQAGGIIEVEAKKVIG